MLRGPACGSKMRVAPTLVTKSRIVTSRWSILACPLVSFVPAVLNEIAIAATTTRGVMWISLRRSTRLPFILSIILNIVNLRQWC